MNLSEMRTRLRRQIGNPTTTDVPDAQLTEHVNDAYREIVAKFRFHKTRKVCTFDTTADTRRYGLPEDAKWVMRVRDDTNKRFIEKTDDHRLSRIDDLTTTGKPELYARYRDWIELQPTPDGVYTISVYYESDITELSADSDEPVMSEAWHRGLVNLAKYYYYDDQGDDAKALSARNKYEAWLTSQPSEVDEEQRFNDHGVQIPSLGEWAGYGTSGRSRTGDFATSD